MNLIILDSWQKTVAQMCVPSLFQISCPSVFTWSAQGLSPTFTESTHFPWTWLVLSLFALRPPPCLLLHCSNYTEVNPCSVFQACFPLFGHREALLRSEGRKKREARVLLFISVCSGVPVSAEHICLASSCPLMAPTLGSKKITSLYCPSRLSVVVVI